METTPGHQSGPVGPSSVPGSTPELSSLSASGRLAGMRAVAQLIDRAQGEYQIFVCSTGAAAGISSILTSVPGSSKVFLGSVVPYHPSLLAGFLHREAVGQAVSEEVALGMANESYLKGQEALVKAGQLKHGKPRVIGVGVTAAIASGQRRGLDRMHIAVRTLEKTVHGHFEFKKGQGAADREWQNELAEAITLNSICAVADVAQVPIEQGRITCRRGLVSELGVTLMPVSLPPLRNQTAVLIRPDGSIGELSEVNPQKHLIYPGSFRYFHCGHDLAARSAMELSGKEVIFEISAANKDKAAIDFDEMLRRSVQFRGRYPVIIRPDAGSFVEKAAAYPVGTQFVVGFDTATRILDRRYYDDSWRKLNEALEYFDSRNVRFHVLGRTVELEGEPQYQTYGDLWCPCGRSHLFLGLAGQLDVSATALCAQG